MNKSDQFVLVLYNQLIPSAFSEWKRINSHIIQNIDTIIKEVSD